MRCSSTEERTEVLVLSFIDRNILMPENERIESGRRFQDPDRGLFFVFERHLFQFFFFDGISTRISYRTTLGFTS